MIYPEKIKKAVHFSSHKHKNQNRMIFDYPYITHPLMVFHLVSKFADDENILCAAILHDTVEDTDTSLRDIKENFGDEVHYLVDILSEDKSLEKIERKEKYYRRIFKENNKNESNKVAMTMRNLLAGLASMAPRIFKPGTRT